MSIDAPSDIATPGLQRPAAVSGQPLLAIIFLLTLFFSVNIPLGPVVMQPHRIVLLVLFVPMLLKLISGRPVKPILADWLVLFSALWAGVSLAANHPIGQIIEPSGIYILEFFGAYLLGRMLILSSADFQRFVKVLYWSLPFMLVLAAVEAFTRRPIGLNLIGKTIHLNPGDIRFGLKRAQVTFAHPILYGAYVTSLLGIVWYALEPSASFVARAARAILIFVTSFFALSSGAMIAFVVQSAFIGWEMITRRMRRPWTLLALLFVALYIFIDLFAGGSPFHVLVRYASLNTGSAYNRILIFEYGSANVMANPLFGLGERTWERPNWMVASVDNVWLVIAMKHGFPAILSIGLAIFLLLRKISLQRLEDPLDRACRAGYLVTMGGLIIAGGTVHYWQAMLALFMFLLGAGGWVLQTPAAGAGQAPAKAATSSRKQKKTVL
ncbi:MAG: O-antigen ligase family protein [Pseudomonadota bacterium]